jgi:hypothetical protein
LAQPPPAAHTPCSITRARGACKVVHGTKVPTNSHTKTASDHHAN